MLDIDYGTYPFVTSSNPIGGGAATGSGYGPTMIEEVIGVSKAYVTRVGEGPFVSELTDETGKKIQDIGHEFGVTTGRPRRCGWFDSVIMKYAVLVGGITKVALTKIIKTAETIKFTQLTRQMYLFTNTLNRFMKQCRAGKLQLQTLENMKNCLKMQKNT